MDKHGMLNKLHILCIIFIYNKSRLICATNIAFFFSAEYNVTIFNLKLLRTSKFTDSELCLYCDYPPLLFPALCYFQQKTYFGIAVEPTKFVVWFCIISPRIL